MIVQPMTHRIASIAAIVLVTPAVALATPPTVISAGDQAFGLSETELFVLRTTNDNLGSHFEAQIETFLVAISIKTGEEVYWHIDSARITTQFGAEGDNDRRVMVRPKVHDRADAFAVLAERGGLPWRAVSRADGFYRDPSQSVTQDAFAVTYEGFQTFRLGTANGRGRVEATMQSVATKVPDYPRMETATTREQFAARVQYVEKCRFAADDMAVLPLTYAPVQLVRATCSDADEIESTTVLIPIPANASQSAN